MSAERIPEQFQEAEIIYVLFPGSNFQKPLVEAATEIFPPNRIFEAVYNWCWNFRKRSAWKNMNDLSYCLLGSVVFAFNSLVVLYALYYLKSMMGIKLVPGAHLETFFPIHGYQRW